MALASFDVKASAFEREKISTDLNLKLLPSVYCTVLDSDFV